MFFCFCLDFFFFLLKAFLLGVLIISKDRHTLRANRHSIVLGVVGELDVARETEEPRTEVALLFRSRQHLLVNIHRGLLLQNEMVDLDLLSLADADSATDGLVHQSGRPPRAHEDDAVTVLEIETHATRLQLDEEHLLLRPDEHLLRGLQGLLLFLQTHTAVIERDLADEGALRHEIILEHLHLLVEVAEDEPAVGLRGLALDELLQPDKLGARLVPVRAAVCPPLPLARPDVHLRMDGNLAKAHDEAEDFGLAALFVLEHAEAPLDDALDAPVELCLLCGLKVEDVIDLFRLVRQTAHDITQVGHLATENTLLNKGVELLRLRCRDVVNAEELEERDRVLERVDDGRGREEPVALRLDALLGESVALALRVCHAVRLIEDDPRPDPLVHQTLTSNGALVVHHIDVLGSCTEVLRNLPLRVRRGTAPDTEPAALGGLLPLIQRTERGDEERGVGLGLVEEAEHLDGLAETHLVTEEPAAGLELLLLHHPADALDLVVLVLEAGPERLEGRHLEVGRREKSGLFLVGFLFNFTGGGCLQETQGL